MQKIALITIIKLFSFKEGSLFLASSLASATGFMAFFTFEDFHSKYEIDKILISLFAFLGFMFIFSGFSFADLLTGIQAAIYENKEKEKPLPLGEVVKSKKMWATIWKGFAVFMICSMLLFICIIGVLIKSDLIYLSSLYMLCTFSIMANGFEFYSIGENTAKMNNGKKKDIYIFFSKILNVIEKRIINRVENNKDQ